MAPSRIIDLSYPLGSSLQIYPGDPPFVCRPMCTVAADGYSVCALSLGSHTGTHLDAPAHFIADGATISDLPLDRLIGPALVLRFADLQPREKITWERHFAQSSELLAEHARSIGIVLIHTGWAHHWGTPAYFDSPFLAGEAAKRLVELGVRVVGIDTMSPDEVPAPGGPEETAGGYAAHETLLGAGVVIVENLRNLDEVESGMVVSLAPLHLEGCDGAPVRAYAVVETPVSK
ncbi:putative cyclase [Schizophyllum commune H4-8]|uniref:Cyclase n=1 Tax=Schizophyllum commune (strain H4-8 / FGSC 9210) TaxID=578458 RepID=D8QA91_SCHCM|nr:putative cyclase [Schizophyllum commune H4-8]KAI5890099.1 putative cyclase [Schizophyllum commune H4-8]